MTIEEFESPETMKAYENYFAKFADKPVSHKHLKALTDTVLAILAFARNMNARNKERNARLDTLECRIAELERRPGLEDKGVWTHGQQYDRGAIVTHQGSAWVCRETHWSTGTDISHDHFRLLVKRGRDAR